MGGMSAELDCLLAKHHERVAALLAEDDPPEPPPRSTMLQRHPTAGDSFVQRKPMRPLREKWLPCPGCVTTYDQWCDWDCPADDPWYPGHNPAVDEDGDRKA